MSVQEFIAGDEEVRVRLWNEWLLSEEFAKHLLSVDKSVLMEILGLGLATPVHRTKT